MAIEIRPMEPQDTAAARQLILSVAGRLFQADAVELFIERHTEELADVDNYRKEYSPPDGLFLVALDGEELIGTAAIRQLDATTAELRRMWLLEPYQGRGIGYRLWRELLAFARAKGYRRVRLTTDDENDRARVFYRRLGFYEIARYGPARQGIFMELKLDDDDAH
jgi:putative acetyltransferase